MNLFLVLHKHQINAPMRWSLRHFYIPLMTITTLVWNGKSRNYSELKIDISMYIPGLKLKYFSKCFNASMLQCFNVSMFQCFNVSMFQCFNASTPDMATH
jgi:hypothetical protein